MKRIIFCSLFLIGIFGQSNIPRVPEWAKTAVWYQIFPERFANGDKANDPTPKDIEGGWPYFIPEGWKVKDWTSDWYKQEEWELKTNFQFYQNAGLRRYGGDIQGIINKLDYLQKLGITAIYLNPVFESPSLHKYDATMYHHIDNNFGPDPEGDRKMWESEDPANPSTWKWTTADKLFLKLISECHKRGMKVIIDGVFNHTGNTFWAFKDIVKNQQNSKYLDWYYVEKFDNPDTKENEFKYNGWFGVQDLPEIRETKDGLTEGPANHIMAVVKRWGDPNGDGNPEDGIDGWRLDVADMVNINFWKKFRAKVKEINPDAYLTGEVWWQDWNNDKMFVGREWLQGDAFDAIMNYRFARAVKNYVADKKDKINSKVFADSLRAQYKDNHPDNFAVMMNLIGSHDVERFSSIFLNPDKWYDHRQNPEQNREFNVEKPLDKDFQKLKMVYGLQMVLPGAPMIYYGDEAGMWGGDDPDCRKPMVWKEFKYDDETTHPFGQKRALNNVKFNSDLFEYIKQMIKIRKENPALSIGKTEFIDFPENPDILIIKRELNDKELIIIVNNSDVNHNYPSEGLKNLNKKGKPGKTVILKPFSVNIYSK